MCGIAGLWSNRLSSESARSAMEQMLELQKHRGPDDVGIWHDQVRAVTLGHRRLAIIDLTSAGHQPMVSGDGKLVVSFNGEIYNFMELRRQLELVGHSFRSGSDTEVLLAGYREWGEALVDRLVGMFAFAIWDLVDTKLFLARDRAGEKPLYYASSPGFFTFASEVGAVAACEWVDARVDSDALARYLRYGHVPSPLSIYRGVSKLPPAHTLSVTAEGVELKRYWDPLDHALAPKLEIGEEDALLELEAKLTTAVSMQLVSDVPLGAFLSGGVDSSALVALMRQRTGSDVRTFTIGFDVADFDESTPAQQVAELLGTTHTCRRIDLSHAMNLADELPAMFGEPFADPSALPTRLVSRVARADVTVALSGDGADELFGGYTVYDRLHSYERLASLARPVANSVLPVVGRLNGQIGRRARRLRTRAQGDDTASYRHYFTDDELGQLLGYPSPLTIQSNRTWLASKRLGARRRAMLNDFSTYLPDDVLTKVDRAAMAESLETRAPFLDHRLIEWVMRLPDRLVRRKHILKVLLAKRLPRELVNRRKQGFDVPIGTWLRGPLSTRLRDELDSSHFGDLGLARNGLIDVLLKEHMGGTANHDRRLWMIFVLARWHAQKSVAKAVRS